MAEKIDIPKMDNVSFWENIEWETTMAQHTPTPICNVGRIIICAKIRGAELELFDTRELVDNQQELSSDYL
jgi:hypothetical protein